MPAEDGDADERHDHVGDQDGAPHVVLVAEPAHQVHVHAREGVGRRDQALRLPAREPQVRVQDEG